MAAPTPGSKEPPHHLPHLTHHHGIIPQDWPAQAADAVVDTIAKVKEKTTKPAIVATRALVYGLLAGVVAVVFAVLLLIFVVRVWENWVPLPLWVLYALLAGGFCFGGLYCLRRANSPANIPED